MSHQNLLEKGFFVLYMKNGLSAVYCIKSFSRELSCWGITYFKLDLFNTANEYYSLTKLHKRFQDWQKKNHCFSSHTWLLLELSYALRAKLIMFVDRSIPRTWAWYVWNKTISWYRTVVTQMCMAIPLI